MNFQDLQNLSEAYLEVVEGRVPWHDPSNPNPSGYTPKEKSEAKRKQLGVENPDAASFEEGGPSEKEYERYGNLSATQERMSKRGQQPKGKLHKFKDYQYWRKPKGKVRRQETGTIVPKTKESSYPSNVKKDVDILRKEETNIILSHLLDRGYAETQEQAEVIMVNMSEEWIESIIC